MGTFFVKEWAIASGDPAGSRHLLTAPAFVAIRASGTSSSGVVDLGDIFRTDGIENSQLKVFTVNFSGVAANETYDSVSVRLVSSDFLTSTHKMLFDMSPTWFQNKTFPEGWDTYLTENILTPQEVIRTSGGSPYFYGSTDGDSSQYLYCQFQTGADETLGTFGGSGSGYSLVFSYTYAAGDCSAPGRRAGVHADG